jgi:predicted dehydrogenase
MTTLNRRTFISTAAAATLAATSLARAAETTDATGKLKLGLIGCGWYGMVDLQAALKVGGVEVIALCDVDSDHLSASADKVAELQNGQRPKTFKLYEEMLATPGLQAVIIGTPPHWHALPFIAALGKGLDVYCEKPLSFDVREGRAMVDAAKRASDRIVQIGFQRRHAAGFQQARQYLQEGNGGKIVQVEAQIHFTAGTLDPTPQNPPPSLDWDLWCGPGPLIPYSPQVGHKNWRLEKTTGQGHLFDWGIHLVDQVRWILGETTPKRISADGGLYQLAGKITTPDVLTAHFEFEKCPFTWRHHIWGAAEYVPEVANGIFFYGERETVFVTDDRWVVVPRDKKKPHVVHEAKSEAGTLHMADFLDAVRTRKPPAVSVEDAHLSTTTVKLAMIAYASRASLDWDGKAEQITNNPEAARLLKRDYRAPWKHPASA